MNFTKVFAVAIFSMGLFLISQSFHDIDTSFSMCNLENQGVLTYDFDMFLNENSRFKVYRNGIRQLYLGISLVVAGFAVMFATDMDNKFISRILKNQHAKD